MIPDATPRENHIPAGSLTLSHLAELRESGLNDATIRAAGLRTEHHHGAIA